MVSTVQYMFMMAAGFNVTRISGKMAGGNYAQPRRLVRWCALIVGFICGLFAGVFISLLILGCVNISAIEDGKTGGGKIDTTENSDGCL